jgi:glycosyltransferase involved in cell wall biosynthesis
MFLNKQKLKICHVITRMIVGGAQENTLFTIIGHIQKGHEVVLVTGPSPGPEGELLKKADFPEFEVVEFPSLVREINPALDIKAYFALKKFFRKRKFDVVHTHSSKAGIIGRIAAWNAGVPLVVHTVHGQAFHPYEKPWKNYIYKTSERWAARRCHRIYAVAQAMIDQCVRSGIAPAEKYQVVHSGMEIEKFLNSRPEPELRKQLGIPENVKVIGSVARLFRQKGYEYFIPAAVKIVEKYPDTHFLVVGNGSMREALDRQINSMGLAGRFHFAGLVPPDQVYRYIAQMDILLHLSLHEGLPRAVVQALASGKPAIGFALDGAPEVIFDNQTGFLAQPENIDSVVEGVLKILGNPALAEQMGRNGKQFVAQKFDWHYMADVLEQEYLKQLQRKK